MFNHYSFCVDLIPFTNYSVEVAAVNSVGNGPFSSSIENMTLEGGSYVYLRPNQFLLAVSHIIGFGCVQEVYKSKI